MNPANGHTNYAIDAPMTWAEAEAWASSVGGQLVAINDAGESEWLRNSLGLTDGYYWLGAHDTAVEGLFAWVTGEPFAFQDFLIGEPDDDAGIGGDGDYLAVYAASVSCRVFDVRGRQVRKIAEGEFAAGTHELAWDVRDDFSRRMHSGTYLIQLEVDGASRVVKVAIMH